jgi:hypothetical protein
MVVSTLPLPPYLTPRFSALRASNAHHLLRTKSIFLQSPNEVFQAYMNHFMPDWKHRRQVLNRLPVRHENWEY